jgi:hypothetical protein
MMLLALFEECSTWVSRLDGSNACVWFSWVAHWTSIPR